MGWAQLTPKQLRNGGLENHDVLIIPGGWAPNYYEGLAEVGQEVIKTAVSGGMGFVGICAGAYLASNWGYGRALPNSPSIDS